MNFKKQNCIKNLESKSDITQLCPTVCDTMDCRLPCDFAGKSTGVGCHFLLQGIFPTQGSNPGLLHCRQTLYRLSHQFSSVTQSCPTLCDPMNHSMPGLPVHHQLPEFTEPRVHPVSDTIQPSHPLWSPSPPAPHPSPASRFFSRVNTLHEVAKVLEFQLQHQSFQ